MNRASSYKFHIYESWDCKKMLGFDDKNDNGVRSSTCLQIFGWFPNGKYVHSMHDHLEKNGMIGASRS